MSEPVAGIQNAQLSLLIRREAHEAKIRGALQRVLFNAWLN